MKGVALTLTATALVLLALAGRSDAQVVTTSITQNNVTMPTGPFNPIILYGLTPSFQATLNVAPGFPIPSSCPFTWVNGTGQTISILPSLAQATTSSAIVNGLAFAYTQPNLIAAGIYNAVHAVFPVCQVGNITYQSSDSRSSQSVPFDAFLQILPASTALSASFTPFTLANFTQSIKVNLTNVNGTNALPQGSSYEVITNSAGTQIGNFSLTATPLNANTLALTLPTTFNASQLLSTGSYTAVITYYPTQNFTQPIPLTIQFSITNVPVPAPPPVVSPPPPPPPPSVTPSPPTPTPSPPSPAPPPSGNGSTTITVEVFYNQVKDFLKECKSRNLYFVANVRATFATNPVTGPTDGTIVFTDGTGAVLAQGPATPCGNGQIGLTVAFSSQGGAYGIGYGQHSVTAAYSGSSNGFWLPSKAIANYVIPDTCNQQNLIQELAGQQAAIDNVVQGAIGAQIQADTALLGGVWGNQGSSGCSSGSCGGGATVSYTPGGCFGGACGTGCQGSNCGGSSTSGSLTNSLSGSLSSITGSNSGSYSGGGCTGGSCTPVSSIG